jgi:purine-cytosine permease-like protein
MKTRSVLGFTFAQCTVFALGLVSAAATGSGVIAFQESGDTSSDNKQQ